MNMSHDITVISQLGNTLKLLKFLEMALTVGIIAFTVLRVVRIFREQN